MHRGIRSIQTSLILTVVVMGAVSGVRARTLQEGKAPAISVWDGIYTAGQALSGQSLSSSSCEGCHGENLGGGTAQELHGEKFMERWRGLTLDGLFKAVGTMPPAGPKLSETEQLNVLAYLLRINGFPAGSAALNTQALSNARIERKDGPKALPDRALVEVIGCLTRGERGSWNLTMASEPVRTRNSEEATPEELTAAKGIALGNRKLELQNFIILGAFEPSRFEGHKMLAKGALLQRPEGNRLSLTALKSVAETCKP